MYCTKNPKKFLGLFDYFGSCDPIPVKIKRFGQYNWGKVEVSKECKRCGCNLGRSIVPDSQAIARYNLDVKKVNGLGSMEIFSTDIEDLR